MPDKRKLFVWAYTHDPKKHTICGLDVGGNMIIEMNCPAGESAKMIQKIFMSEGSPFQDLWEVKVQDQRQLEQHLYNGGSRDLVPLDFQHAWDKYKMGEGILS